MDLPRNTFLDLGRKYSCSTQQFEGSISRASCVGNPALDFEVRK